MLSAFMMIVMLAMVAFALDVGIVINARVEAQRAADAAALAAAWEFVSDSQVLGQRTSVQDKMRRKAYEFANYHTVRHMTPDPQLNLNNDVDGDIVIGRLNNPSDLSELMVFNSILGDNAITVRVRMLSERNRSIPLSFARALGISTADVTAEATAIFDDNIVGFRTNTKHPHSGVLPFVLHVDTWHDFLDGLMTKDDWAFDPQTGRVQPGSDGIAEIELLGSGQTSGKKGQGHNELAPANFGTVDIGNPNNSTRDLVRQIESGPNQQDLSHHGGQLTLDAGSQTMTLNGDSGVSAGIQSALNQIVGDGRTIMLYNQVTGRGNNAMFTVVGFAGVRVMDVQFRGQQKSLLIQPAVVTDPTAVSGNYGESYFVGQPVRLVR